MKDEVTSPATSQVNRVASHDLVDRLFLRFATAYGKHWLDMWEGLPIDAVKAEWARALTGVSPAQIKLALESLNEKGQTFPPTLPEFVALTRQFRRHGDAPRLVDGRRTAPDGYFQSLRDILKRAGDVPRETEG